MHVDGIVAFPVMQAHGSLVLEDNSEVGEAVLAAPVPSSIQAKKQIHSLQRVHLGEDLVIFPNLWSVGRRFNSWKDQL